MLQKRSARPATASGQPNEADVCLIVEGCYPYVPGGVSTWLDWLIRSQPHRTFAVVALLATPPKTKPRYTLPDNVIAYEEVILSPPARRRLSAEKLGPAAETLGDPLHRFMETGGLSALSGLLDAMAPLVKNGVDANRFVRSREAYHLVQAHYKRAMPGASFIDYYWGWRSIVQSIYSTLSAPIPRAKIYHAISTGYAGLYEARAHLETRRPGAVTEHGIYTNERRMEITLATWIRKGLRRRLSVHSDIPDIDGLWAGTFEAISRTCYEASDRITTLYEANSLIQTSDGAQPERQVIIPNGVDISAYAGIGRPKPGARPTVALIGRVTPIKDIKSYIKAIDGVRRVLPDVEGLIVGPTDEDPEYYEECRDLVEKLQLQDNLTFTGLVRITEWLERIHVLVLTSLSEAQPLTILEGGAAGIPFVTTDVGACAEMLLGRTGEDPAFGPGGILVGLVDPEAVAKAIVALLGEPERQKTYGENLKRRVESLYRADTVAAQYDALYRALAPEG